MRGTPSQVGPRAFTLVELLVVVSIVGLLAALVLPASFGRVLTRELVYTAVTRARTRVQGIGPRRGLAQAVATRTQRDSGLAARVDEALARRRTEASR